MFYAGGSKINEIWSLTVGIPRLVKKTAEQAGIHHKPQRGKSSRMLLLQGMPNVLGYLVIRKKASSI